jgi:hypothetical protein
LKPFAATPKLVLLVAETLVEFCQEYGLAQYLAFGRMFRGWARARLGDHEPGLRELRDGIAALADRGTKYTMPLYQARLAEIEAEMGESTLSRIDGALALARDRASIGLTLLRTASAPKSCSWSTRPMRRRPRKPFRTAIAIAIAQKARSFELQAALALAKLYQSTGRLAQAHAALAPAIEGFAPTPEMPEIAEAHALIERLA